MLKSATDDNSVFNAKLVPDNIAKDMIKKGIWQGNCPVPLDRLRLLELSYYDFEGQSHMDGQMIVLDAVSKDVINIFKQLYKQKFPIAKIRLINDYDGSDELSMADNNSSAFICREITGGGKGFAPFLRRGN